MLRESKKAFLPLKRGDLAWRQEGFIWKDSAFLLKIIPRKENIAYGIIVKKKIGSAVVRNHIKRRMRHMFCLLYQTNDLFAETTCAYLVIVKGNALFLDHFASLLSRFSKTVCCALASHPFTKSSLDSSK